MKIVVISGGSGNDALLKGIYSMYPQVDLKVIVNAYDDGKSTGLCRKLTNTLGVSDIRKNHSRMYQIKHFDSLNGNVIAFFEERFDLPKGEEKEFVLNKLHEWAFYSFDCFVVDFFNNERAQDYVYNDFSIANIVYSQMYKSIGYENTNKIICDLFKIPNNVVMNSFENVSLEARTTNGVLKDEASIVGFASKEEKIEALSYLSDEPVAINPVALRVIDEADMIIVSCGTFWSSIYPTLEYGGLYKAINKANCSKLWVMNNEQDKDSYGVGSNKFLEVVSALGLNLKNFVILENNDADPKLAEQSDKYDIVKYSMGNAKGKHIPCKLANAIFKEYFGLRNCDFKHILMDFDNTISSKEPADHNVVMDNIKQIASKPNIQIVSGNDYKTAIQPFIQRANILFRNNVWADAASVCYKFLNKVHIVTKHLINKDEINLIENYLQENFSIKGIVNDDEYISCYKIKPLTKLERSLLVKHLNEYAFKLYGIDDLKAVSTGRTTVDIVSSTNTKANIFKVCGIKPSECLYIGDETEDYGNDYDIAHKCARYIRVANVQETNIILKVM